MSKFEEEGRLLNTHTHSQKRDIDDVNKDDDDDDSDDGDDDGDDDESSDQDLSRR